ncbi:hypothetical protein JCM8208_004280 [Rhodotorula glutinis]
MAPSYQSLPAELLSRVAELVHEQDLAFAASPVPRAVPASGHNLSVEADVPAGTWSSWYGRGIRALVQSITPKQMGAFYFRLEVLGEPLGNLVHHLDADSGPISDSLAAPVACALRKLPNLTSLKLHWEVVWRHVPGDDDEAVAPSEERAGLQRSMRHALGRATSLEMKAHSIPSLLKTLVCIDGARLRKLHWVQPKWLADNHEKHQHGVCILAALVGLVELELSGLSAVNYCDLRRCPPFPSVRTLALSRTGLSYNEHLSLAHHIAPSLSRLTIDGPERTSPSSSAADPLPSPLLPTLKSLSISADTYIPAYHQVHLPALEHFKLSLKKDCHDFPLDVDEVPFPAPLRVFALAFRAPYHYVKASRALLRLFRDAGVHLVIEQGPVSVQELKINIVDDVNSPVVTLVTDRRKHNPIVDTLDWARRRADWLNNVEDGPALHELAHATVRLHQLRLLDRL